uniref:Uncharacterized protein n=1 Tax=Ixodes ricinus TaxID=34613 RepID=A0A147BKZ0_IXORI
MGFRVVVIDVVVVVIGSVVVVGIVVVMIFDVLRVVISEVLFGLTVVAICVVTPFDFVRVAVEVARVVTVKTFEVLLDGIADVPVVLMITSPQMEAGGFANESKASDPESFGCSVVSSVPDPDNK